MGRNFESENFHPQTPLFSLFAHTQIQLLKKKIEKKTYAPNMTTTSANFINKLAKGLIWEIILYFRDVYEKKKILETDLEKENNKN